MRNAWGTAEDGPTTSLKMIARVKKPESPAAADSIRLAKQIRNDILRDEFSYTDAETSDFNERHPHDLVIEDSRNPNRWAQDFQVKRWKSERDGLIPITLEDAWVTAVRNYLERRVSFEVFKAALSITDAETRTNVSRDLENILSATDAKRIAALTNLMNAMIGAPGVRPEMHRTLKALTDGAGYKNNPFLMIAFAATTAYRSETPAIGSFSVSRGKIAEAIRATNEKLYYNSSKSARNKISPSEAAQINSWASILYDAISAGDDATNRRWIGRILSMSDDERRSLKEGDVFSIANPAQTAMRGPFQSEKNLQTLEAKQQKRLELYNQIDRIGKDQTFDLKGDHRQTEYFQGRADASDPKNPHPLLQDDSYSSGGKWEETKKPRGSNTGYTPKLKYVEQRKSIFSNTPVDGVSAPLALYLEHAKWWTINQRMNVITAYLDKKRQLEARVQADYRHVVPPPPDVVKTYIRELHRDGRISVNPHQKRQVFGVLSELERLLEESNAFYRTK